MNTITDAYVVGTKESKYMRPLRLFYTQNGMAKQWDLLTVHDSVAIFLYNTTRKKMVFVKQFRPAVYYGRIPPEERKGRINTVKYPPELGFTIELCAGIVDKNLPLAEIAREEVLEECGYNVPIEKVEKVLTHCVNVGILGATQTLYYCEITDEMRVGRGGGIEEEEIEVIELSINEVKDYVSNHEINSPSGLLFGFYWFLANKPEHVH